MSSSLSPSTLHDGNNTSHPDASSVSPARSADGAQASALNGHHKRLSELQTPLSGTAYYIDGRSSAQYDSHLAPPQPVLVRGHEANAIQSSAYVIRDGRRPSIAQSLPPPKPGSSSTSSISRQVHSEKASLSGYDHTFCGKQREDTILGYPSRQCGAEINQDRHRRGSTSIQPSNPLPAASSPSHVLSTYSLSDDGQHDNNGDSTPTARQTLRSLLHLGLGAVPLSSAIFFYTIIITIYTLCTWPLRLCLKSRPSLGSQLTSLLIGPLNLQRRCIHALPILPVLSRNSSSSSSTTPLSSNECIEAQSRNAESSSIHPRKLVSIHLLAPLIALPLSLCAWIMAVAWGLGAIVSDERAGDDRDERRLAQRLVDYWASWLNWSTASKPRSHPSSERRGRARTRLEMSMAGPQ